MDIPNVFYILQSVIYQLIQFSSNFHHHGHPIYHLLIWSRKLLHDPVAHGAAPHGQDIVKWRKMGCWLVWIMQPEWFVFMEVTIFSTFFEGFHRMDSTCSAGITLPKDWYVLQWISIFTGVLSIILSHIRFSNGCRKIGYCISNFDALSTFYRHFPYWNWPFKSREFLHDLHFQTIHIHSSQHITSITYISWLSNGFHQSFSRFSWVFPCFPMIFAEALGAAGEELQIQVVRQQGRWGPGNSPFFENLGKKVGQSMDFTMKLGEKWRGVFPWNQLQQSDFHISGGSKLRNGFYHQNMWGFTLC